MSAQITFRQLNPDFDQKYADELFHGEESESNQKHKWSATIGKFKHNVSDITIKRNTTFSFPDGEFKNVAVFEYQFEDGSTIPFIVSESLISNLHFVGKANYNKSHLYIYFKDAKDYCRVDDGIYIAVEDCPPVLLNIPQK